MNPLKRSGNPSSFVGVQALTLGIIGLSSLASILIVMFAPFIYTAIQSSLIEIAVVSLFIVTSFAVTSTYVLYTPQTKSHRLG